MPRSPVLTVAAAQFAPQPADVAANVVRSAALIRTAAERGARLLVFPELSLVGYDLALMEREDVWVSAEDPRLPPLREACRATGVTAVVGAPYHDQEGRPRIASLAALPSGDLVAAFKTHLYGAEKQHFVPEERPPVILDVEGWRVGLAICFDAAVPEHAMSVARQQADVYAVSALYVRGEERRLDLHLAARAMDHRMYALLANLTGPGFGWTSCGLSGTWGPTGERRQTSGLAEELVVDDLPAAELEQWSASGETVLS